MEYLDHLSSPTCISYCGTIRKQDLWSLRMQTEPGWLRMGKEEEGEEEMSNWNSEYGSGCPVEMGVWYIWLEGNGHQDVCTEGRDDAEGAQNNPPLGACKVPWTTQTWVISREFPDPRFPLCYFSKLMPLRADPGCPASSHFPPHLWPLLLFSR